MKKILLILSLLLLSTQFAFAVPTGTVAYYKLESNGTDSVGSNTLTETGITYITGKINNGAKFGTKLLSSVSPIVGTGDWTVNFWASTTSSGVNQALLEMGSSTPSASKSTLNVYVKTTNKLGVQVDNADIFTGTSTALVDGGLHMVTLKRCGTSYTLYVDNVVDTGFTYSGLTLGSDLWVLGFEQTALHWSWTGVMDEIAVFNNCLSASDISYLYNSGSPTALQQYPYTLSSITNRFLGFFRIFRFR